MSKRSHSLGRMCAAAVSVVLTVPTCTRIGRDICPVEFAVARLFRSLLQAAIVRGSLKMFIV